MQLKRERAELKYAAPKAKMILNVVFSIFHNNTWHTLHILSSVCKCLHVINYVVACNAGFCLAGKCKIFKTSLLPQCTCLLVLKSFWSCKVKIIVEIFSTHRETSIKRLIILTPVVVTYLCDHRCQSSQLSTFDNSLQYQPICLSVIIFTDSVQLVLEMEQTLKANSCKRYDKVSHFLKDEFYPLKH